jgi:predicted transcriptional regulator of viral defense system
MLLTMLAKLPKALETAPFTLKQAKQAQLTFYQIQSLLKSGEIEQITRGIYCVPQSDYSEVDQFQVATLIAGKQSAICLLSALVYYDLTDLIPKKTWVLVPNARRTVNKDLKFFRVRNPHWKVGIDQEEGFRITSIERTLVDAIIYKRLIGSSTAIEALKRALKYKKVPLGRVLEVAKDLECEHRILPVLEAFI